ncbi:MAG: four helix bundle protein [Kiritimatiellae bacterium]|nr:four helix bundle protein [Kiritimatiellia bacterium]
MKESPTKTKSYAFSIRIVKLFQWLCTQKNERVLSKQLLRCGTSIGANVHETGGAYSEKEFIVKLQIAYKEALETHFWIRLLHDTEYIDAATHESLLQDCDELLRLLSSSLKTLRHKWGMVCEFTDSPY